MTDKKKQRELPPFMDFIKHSGASARLWKYFSIIFTLLCIFILSIMSITFRADYPYLREGVPTVAEIIEVQYTGERIGCCDSAVEVTYSYEYQGISGIQIYQETRTIRSSKYEEAQQDGVLMISYVASNPTQNYIGENPNTWEVYISIFISFNLCIIFFIMIGFSAHKLQKYEKQNKKLKNKHGKL